MKRILLATDSVHDQRTIQAGLLESRCQNPVNCVSSASELLEFFAEGQSPAALILDLDLPDAERILKSNLDLVPEKRQPVVVLVRHGDIETLARAGDMGVEWYLPKPVFRAHLEGVIRTLRGRGLLTCGEAMAHGSGKSP